MEQNIAPEYLEEIQGAYMDFFKLEKELPVLILQLEDADFQRNEAIFHTILEKINQPYTNGIHYIQL